MKRMEDDPHSLTINGEERNGDEFYEHIEAPKFVDLNAPDSHRPGDDRYWFCLRVGCDQKHEEELDPEAIDKNFVLRVMAARSPNIRLRKALYRKDSTKVKCPQSVPPKLSKPRISRLALITSMSNRMADPKVSVNPHSKHHKTPNTKLKQSSVRTKAQTTPANKKRMPNPDAFRSVRNPKVGPVLVPKNKVVAKALVFHSPKKRLKTSLELKTPVKTLCDAMKKLQVTSAKKHVLGYDRPLPSDVPRKQLRGREVKSRVYDGLRCQKGKGQDAKSSKCMKGKKEVKNLSQHRCPLTHEGTENDSSDMEIEEKSRKGSLVEVISNPQGDEGNANAGILMTAEVPKASMNDNRDVGLQSQSNLAENDPHSLQSSNWEGNGICEGKSQIEKTQSCLKTNVDGNDKENNGEVMEIDDKENNSVSDNNRHCDVNTSHLGKKVRSRQNPKDTQAVRTMKKSSKESSNMDAQELQNKKSKPTNPRPFRLRTDERAVKEANLKQKPLKEITPFSRFPQGNTERKHQSAIETSVKNREQSECGNQTYETNDKTPNTTRTDQPRKQNSSLKIKERRGLKLSTTPQRHTISSQQKLVTTPLHTADKMAKSSGNGFKRAKSPSVIHLTSPLDAISSSSRKGQLDTINETSASSRPKETTKASEGGAFPEAKASRSSLHGKRLATIPKEPNFHAVHVPKSCTRRAA